jgi:folate-dependent tRNA-U54 methylase TrmFO/GidA
MEWNGMEWNGMEWNGGLYCWITAYSAVPFRAISANYTLSYSLQKKKKNKNTYTTKIMLAAVRTLKRTMQLRPRN